MAYSVLVAEDQRIARMLIETILDKSERYTLVQSLESAEETAELCRATRIDLVLMDVLFPDGLNGIDAARRIKAVSPHTKVVIMTSMPEVSYLRRAREAGVDSFWYKEVQELPLLTLMDRTMAGEHIYPDATPSLNMGNALSVEFTDREIEVLREILRGLTNAEIAARLGISENTVKIHVAHMLEKTGYPNRIVLAVQARALGVVVNDP